ncbi:MAG: ATP-dependent Clp protease ATP-binding subunit [Paludibacteraceae bacterium]|nr:ATP-dependent Clp protease ATP-binding subunit [Paludibacteraceae bacterium]
MKYTLSLNSILHLAEQEARRLGNNQIAPEHLMLGIIRLGNNKAHELLLQAGVDMDRFKQELDNAVRKENNITGDIPFSRSTDRLLRLTTIEAGNRNADEADAEHLLLAILRERLNLPAVCLKQQFNVTYETIEKMLPEHQPSAKDANEITMDDISEIGNSLFKNLKGILHVVAIEHQMPHTDEETDEDEEENTQPNRNQKSAQQDNSALARFGRDLTRLAEEGKLDPVIGRQNEIQRMVQILARRKKNNPVLTGDPGVGKSAIVEGLASLIARKALPAMKGKRIIALDMASIVAGTTYRGQFEQRMQNIIRELQQRPEVILFIDEIHTIIGAGNAQGSLDAANILKPALARGEIQCIGATTTEEFRKSIERDGALERRFQRISVQPSTREETLRIIKKLASHYEKFHNVIYTKQAIEACVALSERYLTERSFPDKAIDVMDEAGAKYAAQSGENKQPYSVSKEDIAQVVSTMSGVPVQRVALEEKEKLRQLDAELLKHIIGQDDAVKKVVRSIQRSRLGLHDQNRPIGTFFFLGSTGVGKTYLAQCLAQQMFGTKDALIRFDMSEYMEKHAVSLLVGAPPGYVAHEEGGKLTEAVRQHPYSIILFDEIEKAHPDIFNIMLQVLDEGRLTDRQGRQADFRNTIIILTSNVGTRQLRDFGAGIGFQANEMTEAMAEKTLNKALERTFPPEFVNRIDDVVLFNALDKPTIARILDIEIERLADRLKATGHKLVVEQQAREQMLERAFDSKNGARPVKRAVQTALEDPITEKLLQNPKMKTITIKSINN